MYKKICNALFPQMEWNTLLIKLNHKTGSVIFLFQSPDRNPPNKVTAQPKTSEMNRRAKLLTVEGIQKRKNPDKNYVSNVIVHFIVFLVFMTYILLQTEDIL